MPQVTAETPTDLVASVYKRLPERVELARRKLDRPVTLAEKILFNHLASTEGPNGEAAETDGAEAEAAFLPDRVAMQDATAQMALLQFMTAGMDSTAVPTSVHCDHLIQARSGARADLEAAVEANAEVYDFLRTACARYGIGFWRPGSGIIHQVVLEQYAFPGGMMIGTDSHTPNAGGLAMVAIGVGGADAVDVMVGTTLGLRWPRIIGIHLTGSPRGWTSAKDVILKVAQLLTVSGGTGAIIEYFGTGVEALSATGKATICNMGAEIGATCSLFPFDHHSASYLEKTGRTQIAQLAAEASRHLRADDEVMDDPGRCFDQVIEIDLSTLEPHIAGPHTPDRARAASDMAADARANGWPLELSQCLVGSCTNSSYEDVTRAANVARQASARGLRVRTPLLVTPGSERVRATIERDGLLADLEKIGATVLANACGPCIGQWQRDDIQAGQTNSILTSYNRNFPKRNDGNPNTLAFIASPEVVVAYALAGTLDFDPQEGSIDGGRLEPPSGEQLPQDGFTTAVNGFIAPPSGSARTATEVLIRAGSERLQRLEPFSRWDGRDFIELPVLMKASGKCTTDHISPAGPWLRFRGHLENISKNLFSGVDNAFSDEPGTGHCPVDGKVEALWEVASHIKSSGRRWVAIGDANYGEGSSREHAAMEPRYLGGAAVLARSFARIHETNLKKQGMLPLTFSDPAAYDLIGMEDSISILGLSALEPGEPVKCRINHPGSPADEITCLHTMTSEQIDWFRAGGALNLIRSRQAARS